MEETINLILRGCKLANNLEPNITNLVDQPNLLLNSCDDIIKVFSAARDRLCNENDQIQDSNNPHRLQNIDASLVQELLRTSCTRVMDMIQMQGGFDHVIRGSPLMRSSGVGDVHAASSSQKPRRLRKDDGKTRTVRVPAPSIGNTELPPDDGFTWRKYGQKEILGSNFPRGYYRCTHQKLYQCPAKKQVQRLDQDPNIYEVIYRGDHTCHMSSTAPSSSAPIDHTRLIQTQTMTSSHRFQEPSNSPSQPGNWLSMELMSGNRSTGDQSGCSSMVDAAAGTSTVRYGSSGNNKEAHDQFPVVEIADAMFNSCSNSNSNNMDFIFPSSEHKWDLEDNKNN